MTRRRCGTATPNSKPPSTASRPPRCRPAREADHYRGQYEAAQEDITGFVNEIRDLHDQLARADAELRRMGATK